MRRLAVVTLIAGLTLILGVGLMFSLAASWKKQRDLGQELHEITDANDVRRKTLGELTIAITEKEKEIDRLNESNCVARKLTRPDFHAPPPSRKSQPPKRSNTDQIGAN